MAMRVVCREDSAPAFWDEMLYSAGLEAGLCQSEYWAVVIGKIERAKPIFLKVVDGDTEEPVVSLMVFHKTAWDKIRQRKLSGINEMIRGRVNGWLEWFDGPVFYSKNKEEVLEGLDKLLLWLHSYAGEKKINKIISRGLANTSIWINDPDVEKVFQRHGYASDRWATYLLRLDQDEQKLWDCVDHSVRKNVNKSQRSISSVRKAVSLEDLRVFYEVYVSIQSGGGRSAGPFLNWQIQWEEDKKKRYKYYIAQSAEGEALGVLGMYMFNGVATEIASGLTKRAFELKIPAQDMLHWEMLLDAKRSGCVVLNLAGVNPSPDDQKEIGIRRFKEKWGGSYVEFNRPRFDSNPLKCVENVLALAYKKIRLVQGVNVW
ncbi:MAG: peptidoglycan bridge formation glycyltransferase FemA/FemB family protein [Candidatus Omnitrophota bacterium]